MEAGVTVVASVAMARRVAASGEDPAASTSTVSNRPRRPRRRNGSVTTWAASVTMAKGHACKGRMSRGGRRPASANGSLHRDRDYAHQ